MNNRAVRRDAAGVIPAWESIADWDDLLKEILVRLPARSTIRFRKVSKHWLNLLSDSQFATNHSTQKPAPSSISGFYFYLFGTPYRLNSLTLPGFGGNLPPLSFLDGLAPGSSIRVRVMHSSNGLLLCYFPEIIDGVSQGHRKYLVCNPTTKKFQLLPEPVGLGKHSEGFLAFDPTKSSLQYKVVLVSYHPALINIYSSQSLCWKRVSPGQTFVGRSVFWNRAIHWLSYDNILRRFDVDVEKITAIPNPPSPQNLRQRETMYFGECGGGLILIQSALRWPTEFLILELEKDYSRWVIKCTVDLSPLIAEVPMMDSSSNNLQRYNVLGAVEGENGRGLALIIAFSSSIICYHLKYMTWDVLRDLVPGGRKSFYFQIPAFPYVETLFPVRAELIQVGARMTQSDTETKHATI